MYDIEDIPNIPDRQERFEQILVDCYGQYEELSAMTVYFEDAVTYPFAATRRDMVFKDLKQCRKIWLI